MKKSTKEGFALIYFLGYLCMHSLLVLVVVKLIFFYTTYLFYAQKNQKALIVQGIVQKKLFEDCLDAQRVLVKDGHLYLYIHSGYLVWKVTGTNLIRIEYDNHDEKKSIIYLCTSVGQFIPFAEKKGSKVYDVGFRADFYHINIMFHSLCYQGAV